jgi:phosphatidylglycerol:prolipoprotein diacylglycerol transferase
MMMDPVCFHIGSRPVYWYGVMVALAFLAAALHWNYLARRENRAPGYGSELAFWIMLAGLVGARLAYVSAHGSYFLDHPAEIVRFDHGGLIYYGGFLAGVASVWLFARAHRERNLWMGDFAISAVPLAHAVGRLGCFINGCCFGRVHHGWFSVVYPAGSSVSAQQFEQGWLDNPAAAAQPVWPTQLMETAFNLLLYGALWICHRRRRREGVVLALYLTVYPVGRFLLEFLRGDPRLGAGGLNAAQWISVALLLAGAGLWIRLSQSPPTRAPGASPSAA